MASLGADQSSSPESFAANVPKARLYILTIAVLEV
jgi:hypothetical protein